MPEDLSSNEYMRIQFPQPDAMCNMVEPFKFGMFQNSLIAQMGVSKTAQVFRTGSMMSNVNNCFKMCVPQMTRDSRAKKIILKKIDTRYEKYLTYTMVSTRFEFVFLNSGGLQIDGFKNVCQFSTN